MCAQPAPAPTIVSSSALPGIIRVALATLAAAAIGGVAAQSTTAAPVAALQDDRIYQEGVDPAPRVRLMSNLGARIIRVDLRWDLVARRRPADAADPNDGAYDWSQYDKIVSAARSNKVAVLFTVWGTPAWAADPRVARNPRFPDWSRRPRSSSDFGKFGAAAARRYAPRGVRLWEAWNEPNLPLFLRPQHGRSGRSWKPVSPITYATMLRAFYREVKGVDRRARVAGGVTAPSGDRCPLACPRSEDARVPPVDFLRALSRPGLRPPMDAVSHHPYPLTNPRSETSSRVAYVDLYNLDRLVRVVDRTYLRRKPVWLTEFGFATERVPQYPFHVNRTAQARNLADSYRRLRGRSRIKMLSWFLLQDNGAWRSGLVSQGGGKKPAFQAYSLPLATAGRIRGGRTRLVGQVRPARKATRLSLERRTRSGWTPTRRIRTAPDGSFALAVGPSSPTWFRARWRGKAPSGERVARVSRAVRVGAVT